MKFVWRRKRVKSFTTEASTLITRPCKCKLKDHSARTHAATQLAHSGAFGIPRIQRHRSILFFQRWHESRQDSLCITIRNWTRNNWPSRQTAGRWCWDFFPMANESGRFQFFLLSLVVLVLRLVRMDVNMNVKYWEMSEWVRQTFTTERACLHHPSTHREQGVTRQNIKICLWALGQG